MKNTIPGGRRVLVACGMTEKKLRQKLRPLQSSQVIKEILLVRKHKYTGDKIICYSVPKLLQFSFVTVESWRLLVTLYLCIFRRPHVAICMTLILHGMHTYACKFFFRVPLIHHVMGKQDLQLHDPRRIRLQKIMWWFSLKADVLVVRGEPTRRLFIEKGGKLPNRVFVQYNVFDISKYVPAESVVKCYDLVYVGYLLPYKNVNLLIDILAELKKRRGKVRLALIGEGKLKRTLQRQCRKRDITDSVDFLGACDEERLVNILRSSKVFVMTSLGEGLPQAMIEAMACGLPCVMFDDADMREIIRPEENGVLVQAGDIDKFVNKVNQLLDDDGYYRHIALGALSIHEEFGPLFTVEAQERVWTNALQAALADREEEA